MMPGAGGDVNTTTPLVLNILAALLCGGTCVSSLVGIVGIVFAVQAGNAKKAGDVVGARAKAKLSMTMCIASVAIGVLGYALLGIFRAS
jgi:hypothetical protein